MNSNDLPKNQARSSDSKSKYVVPCRNISNSTLTQQSTISLVIWEFWSDRSENTPLIKDFVLKVEKFDSIHRGQAVLCKYFETILVMLKGQQLPSELIDDRILSVLKGNGVLKVMVY